MDIWCPAAATKIGAMIKRLRQFNPEIDDYIAYVNQEGDGVTAGPEADIDCFVYHSKKHGFYLMRNIVQVRRGRVWMNSTRKEGRPFCPEDEYRCLTTLRPLTRGEAIRMILESYLPSQEGAMEAVMEALTSAGVI